MLQRLTAWGVLLIALSVNTDSLSLDLRWQTRLPTPYNNPNLSSLRLLRKLDSAAKGGLPTTHMHLYRCFNREIKWI
jgi:hypothetical protein